MSPVRVLHVDDEPDMREIVSMSLGLDPDFSVMSCASGGEAIAAAGDLLPDIVLLDAAMPVMDGPATLTGLRKAPRTTNVPVIFLTARVQQCDRQMLLSLGAVGVIPKPFDPTTLAAQVRKHLQMRANLERARNVFVARMSHDASALARSRADMLAVPDLQSALEELRLIAHGLSGAAGFFDFHQVGAEACALEEIVGVMLDDPAVPTSAVDGAIARLLAEIKQACPTS